ARHRGRAVDAGRRGRKHSCRALPEYRHRSPCRRGEDDADRAHPVLHGSGKLLRKRARGLDGHGLDGTGARPGHHHHQCRHHLSMERAPDKLGRHAWPRRFHHGGGAILTGPGRRRGGARRSGWGGAADRDGVATGRQAPGAAALLREQDGPGARRLRPVGAGARGPAGRQGAAGAAADRGPRGVRGRRGPRGHEGREVGRARHLVRGLRIGQGAGRAAGARRGAARGAGGGNGRQGRRRAGGVRGGPRGGARAAAVLPARRRPVRCVRSRAVRLGTAARRGAAAPGC
ncbi:unnamed protein product, partial [Prorocentrum cordatum]